MSWLQKRSGLIILPYAAFTCLLNLPVSLRSWYSPIASYYSSLMLCVCIGKVSAAAVAAAPVPIPNRVRRTNHLGEEEQEEKNESRKVMHDCVFAHVRAYVHTPYPTNPFTHFWASRRSRTRSPDNGALKSRKDRSGIATALLDGVSLNQGVEKGITATTLAWRLLRDWM